MKIQGKSKKIEITGSWDAQVWEAMDGEGDRGPKHKDLWDMTFMLEAGRNERYTRRSIPLV